MSRISTAYGSRIKVILLKIVIFTFLDHSKSSSFGIVTSRKGWGTEWMVFERWRDSTVFS